MEATKVSYDYIIIGGGTSGLVLAARLSEDPSINVLVLEAGTSHLSDPRVTMPAGWPALLGSDADWSFLSKPQKPLNGRSIGLPQGRSLGGSSAINTSVFLLPSRANFDAWAAMGNSGWHWKAMEPYFRKFCTVTLPEQSAELNLPANLPTVPNSKGPIEASWGDVEGNPLPKLWLNTFRNIGWGFKGDVDMFSGEATGALATAGTVSPSSRRRSYAAGYYQAAQARPNLTVLTEAHVQKILFKDSHPLTATGVEYMHQSQKGFATATASKEVILAAGSLQSPKLLELSGIGSPAILEPHGIKVLIDNSHVGENLQDHVLAGISLKAAPGVPTGDDLARQKPDVLQAAMEQYAEQKGPLSHVGFGAVALLPLSSANNEPVNIDDLLKQYPARKSDPTHHEHIRSLLKSDTEASGKYFIFAAQGNWGCSTPQEFVMPKLAGNYFTANVVLLNPFSAGNSHISSTNANDPPVIDPKYFNHPLDIEVLARHLQFLDQKVMRTEPAKSLINPEGQHHPLYQKYGSFEHLENAKQYLREAAITNCHYVGTCAMLPREQGGVVDENLKVYGTKNLRVVDASIMPMIPRANTVTTVYAVAERAADIIKQGQ